MRSADIFTMSSPPGPLPRWGKGSGAVAKARYLRIWARAGNIRGIAAGGDTRAPSLSDFCGGGLDRRRLEQFCQIEEMVLGVAGDFVAFGVSNPKLQRLGHEEHGLDI